jgi:hypothetical protein
MGIQNAKLRRSIVGLVKQIAGEDKQNKHLVISEFSTGEKEFDGG